MYIPCSMPAHAENVRNAWDDLWDKVARNANAGSDVEALGHDINQAKLEFMRPLLPTRGQAVEIGCGSAELLALVGTAVPGLELHAFDNSETALLQAAATAQKTGRPILTRLADARGLEVPDASFDLVLSGGLLEHFENPAQVLREMVRILRPGGVFYADVVPRKFSLFRWREAKRMWRSPYLMPGVYESTLGANWYHGALAALGCVEIRTLWCGVYPPRMAGKWAKKTKILNGSALAELLGWYFMISARKGFP